MDSLRVMSSSYCFGKIYTIKILLVVIIIIIKEKCHQEVDNLFNRLPTKTSSEISYEDIMKMDYLNQVVKESMRLHPPVSSIARITTEPVSLGEYL